MKLIDRLLLAQAKGCKTWGGDDISYNDEKKLWQSGAIAVLEILTDHDSMEVCDAAHDILDVVRKM